MQEVHQVLEAGKELKEQNEGLDLDQVCSYVFCGAVIGFAD